MLFVSGLMGPYMSPIPANASAAMMFSFFVAVMVTPWLMAEDRRRRAGARMRRRGDEMAAGSGRCTRAVARPMLATKTRSLAFLLVVGVLSFGSLALLYTKDVTVKLLAVRQQVGTRRGHRHARRHVGGGDRRGGAGRGPGRARAARKSNRSRPMPGRPRRSTSTGWCVTTTCAPAPEHGRPADQPDAKDRARPRKPRDRARDPRADCRLDVPEGTSLKVVEPPPGPPVHGDAAGGGLRTGCRNAPRGGGPGARGLRGACRLHRRCRRQSWRSAGRGRGVDLDQTIWNSSRSRNSDVFDTLRRLNGGSDGRLFASRRRPHADPDPCSNAPRATG
jgi:hypothetical protein